MRVYETAFLISPTLSEEENEKLVDQMAEVISKKKGKMISLDRWGKKKLAYPIQKFEEAYYIFFLYEGTPDLPVELERRFKQTEAIIRFLTIKQEERENIRDKKKTRTRASRKPKRQAREAEERPAESEALSASSKAEAGDEKEDA